MIETKESLTGNITEKASLTGSVNKEVQVIEPTLQDKTTTPTQETQVIQPDTGYNGLSQVTVNPIPSEYIIPSGTIDITENGEYNVTNYASANVTVGDITPTTPTEIKNKLKQLSDDFIDYASANYTSEVYTSEAVTVYSPDLAGGYDRFAVVCTTSNKYKILWYKMKRIAMASAGISSSSTKFTLSFGQFSFGMTTNYDSQYQNYSVTVSNNTAGGTHYDSAEYDTLELAIAALKSNQTTYTYNSSTTGVQCNIKNKYSLLATNMVFLSYQFTFLTTNGKPRKLSNNITVLSAV